MFKDFISKIFSIFSREQTEELIKNVKVLTEEKAEKIRSHFRLEIKILKAES